jgi:hypothetical protein
MSPFFTYNDDVHPPETPLARGHPKMKNPLLPWLKSREIQLLQRKRAPAKRRERKKRDIRRGLEAKFINSLYSRL